MDIDLNHAATAFSSFSVYRELWYACAGPQISLPTKGDHVVYLPQGHLEQTTFSSIEPLSPHLPPHVFCTVVNVQLLANRENDEVYTRLSLLPMTESNLEGRKTGEEADEEGRVKQLGATPHMFCKTLTASDTSTHGGFSVPRRAAEDCFPRLDYKQQRPSQELVARDLHGVQWRFRHIYRGQPRRHLLTTGWSIFVAQKSLNSGDAVLFLRGADGELRLGIRRAAPPRNPVPVSVSEKHASGVNFLSAVASAFSSRNIFDVFYSPRWIHADFVVPYSKFIRGVASPICVGTRVKMRYEMDDAQERSGMVMGIGDIDPHRWANSKWRCLVVRWDETATSHVQRVSPWEVDPSGSPSSMQAQPRLKKLRASQAEEFEGLQGQENNATVAVGRPRGGKEDCGRECRVFGVSLGAKRRCTKVQKQGSVVGRAVDLGLLGGYEELMAELEWLFGMEGALRDPARGWRVLYTDKESDVMVVGDDPWHEFCEVVTKIHIVAREEVDKMTKVNDDTQSCLEQGHNPAVEVSKSSSVGQPDSSHTGNWL